jgi:GAF domain-containing protein
MIPLPHDDAERIDALHAYDILDTPKEVSFDALTRLAARIFGVHIALVSLVDEDRQWFKSAYGLEAEQTPRDQAFCTYAIMDDDPLIVLDATLDDRFRDNPLVTGAPGIRFYAGAPLITPDNYRIGTFCIIDTKPRDGFRGFERNHLADFAATTIDILEMRHRMLYQSAPAAAAE